MAGEEATQQLHKNSASNIEQVLVATPNKAPTLQVRWTRHAGHCWRSRNELISDVLLWTPTYGLAKAGQPARTYIQQLCDDTGCSPEDLPETMKNREKWQERIRDICASDTPWWWWFLCYGNVCVAKMCVNEWIKQSSTISTYFISLTWMKSLLINNKS